MHRRCARRATAPCAGTSAASRTARFGYPGSIGAAQIVVNAVALLSAERLPRPVDVGLSTGGFFAAQTDLAGQGCIGLLLINTLRKPSPRLE